MVSRRMAPDIGSAPATEFGHDEGAGPSPLERPYSSRERDKTWARSPATCAAVDCGSSPDVPLVAGRRKKVEPRENRARQSLR
jgi:hypothetical protein